MSTTTVEAPTAASTLKVTPRYNQDRGNANHGWLKTFHTFSFASYQDNTFDHYGALRVINEDRVTPTEGFGTHGHAEFEIFSYLVSGELAHRDSLNNYEVLKRGDLQMTSTGTGIRHSEFNDNKKEEVHFLQIWALPNARRLKPSYYTRHFTDAEKRDKWAKIVGALNTEGVIDEREAGGPAPVHADLCMWATLLSPSNSLTHTLSPSFSKNTSAARKVFIHVVQTTKYNPRPSLTHSDAPRIRVNGGDVTLGEGDGAFVDGGVTGQEVKIENVGGGVAEVLLFEMD